MYAAAFNSFVKKTIPLVVIVFLLCLPLHIAVNRDMAGMSHNMHGMTLDGTLAHFKFMSEALLSGLFLLFLAAIALFGTVGLINEYIPPILVLRLFRRTRDLAAVHATQFKWLVRHVTSPPVFSVI